MTKVYILSYFLLYLLFGDLESGAECIGNLTRRDEPRTEPLGCYVLKINSPDSLNGLASIGFPDPYLDRDGVLMDPGLCIIYCANYLFTYSALRNGKQCRCGSRDGLNAYIQTNSSDCSIPCVGNASYTCGGEESYTVYNAILSQSKIPASGIPPIDKKLAIINNLKNDPKYQGCVKDSPYCNVRILNSTQEETNNMTVDICIDYCRQNNYTHAGLEVSTQCFCGNNYDSLTALYLSDCGSSCVGNNSQICGGPLALSVYVVSQILSSPSSTQDPSKSSSSTAFSPTSSSPGSSDNNFPKYLIAVIALSTIIGAGLIIGIAWIAWKCFRRVNPGTQQDNNSDQQNNNSGQMDNNPGQWDNKPGQQGTGSNPRDIHNNLRDSLPDSIYGQAEGSVGTSRD